MINIVLDKGVSDIHSKALFACKKAKTGLVEGYLR